ncbi:NAD-dependent epimerase/dehydratase family protein [Streptomyces sp. NP160]|uniref:NAD-dependent epimerase/dehydratase family protein n=1 Tax=Streptomyces sp. NP160 TaxID=2586637 RepID=UPI001119240C|nr:NAD-dependent epimerase/dehydratase family protein [Streptomyces sp. NP160]TNM66975.1 NAD-dependent epimerase/dehydratase family protein [Streptomyces sp. NP160]
MPDDLLVVTGGAGFIGSAVVRAAFAGGWRVRVLDSGRPDVHGRPPTQADLPDGVELVVGDVRDARTLDAVLAGATAVSHQAAKVGLGVDLQDAPDYAETNVTGTAQLVAAMARADVGRLVLASSMVVYGEGAYRRPSDGAAVRPAPRDEADLAAGRFDPRDPATGEELEPDVVTEDARLDPRSTYALTKLTQEHLAAVWARETGGRVAALRYHNVYGPGMPRDTPYAGVAAIFRSALEHGRAPRVFEDGAQRRDLVHVDDVARAGVAALAWTAHAPAGTSRAFNTGSGTVTTVLELATALSEALGGPPPEVTGAFRAGDVRHVTASSQRAAAELGWRAAVPVSEGLREFAVAPLRA